MYLLASNASALCHPVDSRAVYRRSWTLNVLRVSLQAKNIDVANRDGATAMPKGLVSELEMAAAKGDFRPTDLSLLLDRTVDKMRLLHRESREDQTVPSVIQNLGIASRRASRLSKGDATEILLEAAEALRIMLDKKT